MSDRLEKLRTVALIELDVEKFKTFCREVGAPPASSDEVVLAGMHKARLFLPYIDAEGKDLSRTWLHEQGYSPTVTLRGGRILADDLGDGLKP